jgi:hypothetical protein
VFKLSGLVDASVSIRKAMSAEIRHKSFSDKGKDGERHDIEKGSRFRDLTSAAKGVCGWNGMLRTIESAQSSNSPRLTALPAPSQVPCFDVQY